MQLRSMLRVEGVEGNEIRGGDWLGGRQLRRGTGMALTQLFNFFKKRAAAASFNRTAKQSYN